MSRIVEQSRVLTEEDIASWSHTPSGELSVRSTYHCQVPVILNSNGCIWKRIWHLKVP